MNSLRAGFVALLLALAARPTAAQQTPPSTDPVVEAAGRAEGILGKAAWQSIFNGRDLAGWRGDTAG